MAVQPSIKKLKTIGENVMEWWQVLLIVLGVTAIVLVVLAFVGKKMQAKVNDQQALIDQSKMTTSILVIDKKKMKIQDSNLPKVVQDQVPFYLKFRKVPLVKAKIGPKIMTLMCDEKVYKDLPVKKQVKVDIAGMYIVALRSGAIVNKSANTTKSATPAKKALDFKNLKNLKLFKKQ